MKRKELEEYISNPTRRKEITDNAVRYLVEHSENGGNTEEYRIISDLLTIVKN